MTASKTPEIKSHKIESQKNHELSTQKQGLKTQHENCTLAAAAKFSETDTH
jgi:hypothetical protein